jgi:hypothetical protein
MPAMPLTNAEKQARIDQINQLLQLGVQSESSDGQSTSFNHDTLRQERDRLQDEISENPMPRVFRFGGRNGR